MRADSLTAVRSGLFVWASAWGVSACVRLVSVALARVTSACVAPARVALCIASAGVVLACGACSGGDEEVRRGGDRSSQGADDGGSGDPAGGDTQGGDSGAAGGDVDPVVAGVCWHMLYRSAECAGMTPEEIEEQLPGALHTCIDDYPTAAGRWIPELVAYMADCASRTNCAWASDIDDLCFMHATEDFGEALVDAEVLLSCLSGCCDPGGGTAECMAMVADDGFTDQGVIADCLRARAVCFEQLLPSEAAWNADYCLTLALLIEEARAAAAVCLALDCLQVEDCLAEHGAMGL